MNKNKNQNLPSLNIELFLDFLREVEGTYNLYTEYQKEQEDLTQDLLHKLEIETLTENEKRKLATQLRTNRKDRRFFKDKVEELTPVFNFVSDNKKVIYNLQKVLSEVRKQEKYHENRNYYPKVLKYKEFIGKDSENK